VLGYSVIMTCRVLHGLLVRMLLALDESQNIVYCDLAQEVTNEADYDTAISGLEH
jgi:peroxiredoxin